VAPEKPDVIEFFAPEESFAEREGFAPPCSKWLINKAFCSLFESRLYHFFVPGKRKPDADATGLILQLTVGIWTLLERLFTVRPASGLWKHP
jgi:hypothetical protein